MVPKITQGQGEILGGERVLRHLRECGHRGGRQTKQAEEECIKAICSQETRPKDVHQN